LIHVVGDSDVSNLVLFALENEILNENVEG